MGARWSPSDEVPRGSQDAVPERRGLRVMDGLSGGRPPASRISRRQHAHDPGADRERATRPMRVTIEERVILNPPLGYAVDARYPAADVQYTYRFDAEGDGTRVTLDVDVRPRHIGWILIPLATPWWRRYTERDLDFHLEAMGRDLSR